MDFFDNAVNKAREALDIACKKTGEVVSLEKQKYNVSNLKSKQEKLFAALGRIRFSDVKDDGCSGKEQELVNQIKQLGEKIDELNAEILNAKNKRVCPACGANIDSNSVFCSACGARLTVDSREN